MPLDFIYHKIKNTLRQIDMRIERAKYGYIEKLPEDIKYFEGGLYDMIYDSACKYPHNVAIDYYGLQVTYRELIKKINRVAAALKAIGVEKGDCVTVCMPNTPESVYMFYAINEVGAIANMVHPLSSEKEIEDYLKQSKSKVMLCIDISYPKVEAIIKNTSLERVIVVAATRSMDLVIRAIYKATKGRKNHVKKTQRVTTWDRFLAQSNKFVGNPHTRVNSDDDAIILYSGGTTGKPKGVVLSNLNFNAQAMGAKFLVPDLLKPRYSMLSFLPNFHAFGLGVCIHIPLYCGMRVVLIPQFNAKKFRSYIKRYRINILVGVPTAYEYLMKLKFKKNELKVVKGLVSGGDIISQSLKDDLYDFLRSHGSKAKIHNGYGLTEASGGMVFPPASVADEPGALGFPLPDSEVFVLDLKTGRRAKTGEDGELLVRGLTVMKRYLNNPKETAAAFSTHQGKKYLHTGDIGYVNKDGLVFFKTRLKRMIITNGYNVYPSTIENATMKSEYVEKCAVVGVPDKLRGQRIKVFIVLKDPEAERAAKKDLGKIYKKYLAKYETPREFAFLPDFPKTKLAKIDFKALEDM